MRKHEQVVEASEHQASYHPMASSAWADVWRVPILICTVLLIACVPVMIWYASTHWSTASEWVEIGLVVVLAIVGVKTYSYIRKIRHNNYMDDLDRREREAEVDFQIAKQRLLEQASMHRANVKVHDTGAFEVIYSPPERMIPQVTVTEEKMVPKQLPPPHLELPGRCDLTEMLDVWRPSPQEILLGIAPGGRQLVVPLKSLCHVALAGATGNGKSVLMRLLLSQILYVNAQVMMCDPHYADIDPESGEDWRPIRKRLYCAPAVAYPTIKDMLSWMAVSELPARLQKRRDGLPIGTPYFLAMDELPAIVKHIPEAPDYMADILREGRKVGLYLVSAAQDWLVKTVGGSGGVRDCFRTAFYVGGDATSARVLLDVKGTVDDGTLGKGIVMLRSNATPMASLARIPYVSNDALNELLSNGSQWQREVTSTTTARPTTGPLPEMGSNPTARPLLAVDSTLDARALRIREMVREKIMPSKIIEEVWGISAKTGGTAYAKAARELSEIMASLLS